MAPTPRSIDDLYNELLEIKATQKIILDRLNESDDNGPRSASVSHVPKTSAQASQNQRHHQKDRVPPMNHNVSPGLSDNRSAMKRQHPDPDDSAPSQDLDFFTASLDQRLRVKRRLLASDGLVPSSDGYFSTILPDDQSPTERQCLFQDIPAPPTNDDVSTESLAVHLHNSTSFLGIPLEIRLEIYKFLLADCPPVIVDPHDRLESSTTYVAPFPGIRITPLLKVSKQINAEASPLLWSIPRFHFSERYFGPSDFDEGAQRCKLITNLRVTIGSYENISNGTPERRHQLNSQAISFSKHWFGYSAQQRFSGLRHLELDFRPWDLQEVDVFPQRLVEGFRKQHARKKLVAVAFLGLETQPDVRRELEEVMVGG